MIIKEKLGALLFKSLEKIKDAARPLTGGALDKLGPQNQDEAQAALSKGFEQIKAIESGKVDAKSIVLDSVAELAESAS